MKQLVKLSSKLGSNTQTIRDAEGKAKKELVAKNLEAEKKINEAIAKKVAEKKAAAEAANVVEEPVVEETATEEAAAE